MFNLIGSQGPLGPCILWLPGLPCLHQILQETRISNHLLTGKYMLWYKLWLLKGQGDHCIVLWWEFKEPLPPWEGAFVRQARRLEDNPLTKHDAIHHNGTQANYSMRVLRRHKVPLAHQIQEATEIELSSAGLILNSKGEFPNISTIFPQYFPNISPIFPHLEKVQC